MARTRTAPRPGRRRAVAAPKVKKKPVTPKLETDAKVAAAQLAKVRAFCATLPGSDEKLSHGAPTWFVKAGVYAYFCNNHHGDGKIALWCAAPEGAQAMLVESVPDHYFVPAYVGHMGWVGVRLDRDAAWSEVTSILEAAHAARSMKKAKRR
jgi:hypothetical protein